MIPILLFISWSSAFAQIPLSTESMQLQEIINKSSEQLKSLEEILKYSKQNATSLDRASQALEELSAGIDQSIAKYQGTPAYQKALLELQSKNEFDNSYSDSQRVREHAPKERPKEQESADKSFQDIILFQKQSVKANEADLTNEANLEQALLSAQQGFIPKIQAQAELGNWQANTRVSSQMTELLAATHAMREELRAARLKSEGSTPLNQLVYGAEIQNRKRDEKSR